MAELLVVHPEVADALASGGPVVALESTIISHGLPRPTNLDVAREIEGAVRDQGATPATIAIVDGTIRVGLDDDALATIAGSDDVVKASVRDLAVVVARGGHGATTVASTAELAAQVGIEVFATGGLGGVHRGASDSFDESADLTTLGSTPITVVSAGVKSILDVAATLERLETLNVTVVGYGTDRFPGFYLADSGHAVPHRVDSPEDVAAIAVSILAKSWTFDETRLAEIVAAVYRALAQKDQANGRTARILAEELEGLQADHIATNNVSDTQLNVIPSSVLDAFARARGVA